MSAGVLVEAAPAKVNLYLHVVGRRADGYHLLDSLAVFPGAGDVLRATMAEGLSLRVGGAFGAGLGDGAENLVLRAARALAAVAGVRAGAALELDKRLPVASGIGGGSADAAAALRLLSRLWGVVLPEGRLLEVAASLGADVPVCLASRPARMEGVGEVLGEAPRLPAFGMVLVNPGVAVPTPDVFRQWAAARTGEYSARAALPGGWDNAAAMAAALRALGNDLEAPARTLCPPVDAALAWLGGRPGCLLARMSGSGATCFGLFEDAGTAERAADRPPAGWWCWAGSDRHS